MGYDPTLVEAPGGVAETMMIVANAVAAERKAAAEQPAMAMTRDFLFVVDTTQDPKE